MPFRTLSMLLAAANAAGAFASLLAGLSDRFGRANLVVYGLLLVGLAHRCSRCQPSTARSNADRLGVVVGFVEGIILVATPALIRDFSPQVGRATAMGFWTIGPVLGSLATSAVNSATLPYYPGPGEPVRDLRRVRHRGIRARFFLFLRELKPRCATRRW